MSGSLEDLWKHGKARCQNSLYSKYKEKSLDVNVSL